MTGGKIAYLIVVLSGFGAFMALMMWCTFSPEGGKRKRTADRESAATGSPVVRG
jgi:hypothetical protein